MISVCMATFNGGKYIAQQISSILSQLTFDDELIISDDGSTDNTIDIIKSFNDVRIKLLINKKQKTSNSKHFLVTKNFENALQNAQGDLIFLADQDDIWKDNKVDTSLAQIKGCDILLSNYDIINEFGEVVEIKWLKKKPIRSSVIENVYKMPFHGCCMCFTKEVLEGVLPFPKSLLLHDNWIGIFWSLKNFKKIKFLDESLVLYRHHSYNVSGKSSNSFYNKILYRITFLLGIYKRLLINKNL